MYSLLRRCFIGDSCCFSFSLGHFQKQLNKSLPGVYIHSLRIGSSIVNDVESGYFKHPDEQIKEACTIINADPKLADGYNAIGFSQGSQFLYNNRKKFNLNVANGRCFAGELCCKDVPHQKCANWFHWGANTKVFTVCRIVAHLVTPPVIICGDCWITPLI